MHLKQPSWRLALPILTGFIVGLICGAGSLHAQGDGPRAYFPAPVDSNLVSLYGMFIRGNQSLSPGAVFAGSDLDLDVGVVQYTRTFSLCDQAAAAFAIVPLGEVSGSLDGGPVRLRGRSSGLGDINLGMVIGLVGSPALVKAEYATFDPGFALGLLGKVILPTGEYSEKRVINLGSNRWAFQLGAPMSYYLGDSLLDANLTSFDLLPSVTFFSDNDDPFGAGTVEQDPLFRVEGHLTRNLHKALWLSLDGLYTYGAETTTDGVDGDNTQRSFSLGGTIGVNLSAAFSIKASYGEVIWRNDDGPDGRMFRIVGSLVF